MSFRTRVNFFRRFDSFSIEKRANIFLLAKWWCNFKPFIMYTFMFTSPVKLGFHIKIIHWTLLYSLPPEKVLKIRHFRNCSYPVYKEGGWPWCHGVVSGSKNNSMSIFYVILSNCSVVLPICHVILSTCCAPLPICHVVLCTEQVEKKTEKRTTNYFSPLYRCIGTRVTLAKGLP